MICPRPKHLRYIGKRKTPGVILARADSWSCFPAAILLKLLLGSDPTSCLYFINFSSPVSGSQSKTRDGMLGPGYMLVEGHPCLKAPRSIGSVPALEGPLLQCSASRGDLGWQNVLATGNYGCHCSGTGAKGGS